MSDTTPNGETVQVQALVDRVTEATRGLFDQVIAATVHNTKMSERDIEHRMYEQASMESARYAIERMVTAAPVRPRKYADGGRYDLLELALGQVKVDGFHAEFGVHTGDTLAFIANRVDRVVYGFDSFEGLPQDWFLGVSRGAFDLKGQLPQLDVPRNNYSLVKGWFDQSLPGFAARVDGPAAFLHIDCDLYESTRTVLTVLADRIVPGTVIVFDEYLNYPGWQAHEFKAFREFCAERRVAYRYLAFTPVKFSVAVMIEAVG
jgi:hypothetical protein